MSQPERLIELDIEGESHSLAAKQALLVRFAGELSFYDHVALDLSTPEQAEAMDGTASLADSEEEVGTTVIVFRHEEGFDLLAQLIVDAEFPQYIHQIDVAPIITELYESRVADALIAEFGGDQP